MKTTAQEIQKAKEALIQSHIVNDMNKTYPSTFNGYISSFGASLVLAGLLPTVVFFERPDSGAEEERDKVINALKKMMDIADNVKMAAYILEKENDKSIRRCDDPVFVKLVVQNMTAMKLALRLFEKQKENNNGKQ